MTLNEVVKRVGVDTLRRNPATPLHPFRRASSGAGIIELPVVKRLQRKVPIPRHPPRRRNKTLQRTLYEHRPRVLLPRPPQIRRVERIRTLPEQLHVLIRPVDRAVLEDEAGGLAGVNPAVCRHGVVRRLRRIFLPGGHEDPAAVEDRRGAPEDEVDVALDAAGLVVVAERVGAESVLVAQELAAFYYGMIAV